MTDEHERIEKMRAEGKVTAEEAERLKAALGKAERAGAASPAPPAIDIARPRLSIMAVASALCLPLGIVVGIVAGVLAHLASGRGNPSEATAWIGVLSGTAVFLVGLILGVAALTAIRGEPDKLRGKGFAWVGILQLPVVWFFLFMWLHRAGASRRPADRPPAHGSSQPTGVPPKAS